MGAPLGRWGVATREYPFLGYLGDGVGPDSAHPHRNPAKDRGSWKVPYTLRGTVYPS